MSNTQERVMEYLRHFGPAGSAQVAEGLGLRRPNVRDCLWRLYTMGKVGRDNLAPYQYRVKEEGTT